METAINVNNFLHKDLLAWVDYQMHGTNCYVYPQYVRESTWMRIDSELFPDDGAFRAQINGNSSFDSNTLRERYGGNFVIVRINADTFYENKWYQEADGNDHNRYYMRIHPDLFRGKSDCEFKKISSSRFSSEYMQIVNLYEDIPYENASIDSFTVNEPSIPQEGFKPITKMIFVKTRNSDSYYGPFEYECLDSDQLTLQASAEFDYRILEISLENVDYLELKHGSNSEVTTFISREDVAAYFEITDTVDMIDWIPDDVLIDLFGKAIKLGDSSWSKSQMRTFKTVMKEQYAAQGRRFEFDEVRCQRLNDMGDKLNEITSIPDIVAKNMPQEQILQLVEENPNILRNVVDELHMNSVVKAELDKRKETLNREIEDLKKERVLKTEALESLEQDIKAGQGELQQLQVNIQQTQTEVLKDKQEEIENLENKKIELKEKIEELTQQCDNLAVEYARNLTRNEEINNKIDERLNNLGDEIYTSEKILESEMLKKIIAAVSGASIGVDDKSEVVLQFELDECAENENELITNIYEYIHSCRCSVDTNDVINYMICLCQGYITTFAGYPGTGKTSLCNLLANAIGLNKKDDSKRFIEVNVENGWTSYKDYVGYYNPLSKAYEKSNTLVFDAMRQLSNENDNEREYPPCLFLLDEANLSPIEYYWSPFLRACDSYEQGNTILSLGGNEPWNLPPHIRFLATVNFDHTTEPLSQRFLDRSWVIKLEAEDFMLGDNDLRCRNDENVQMYSYDNLMKVFGPRIDNLNSEESQRVLEDLDNILEVCSKNNFFISPRSQIMIKRYLSTAIALMDTDSKDGQNAPLDFAVSQKILPLISGPAESCEVLIDELLQVCGKLERTKKQLDHMRKLGKESGFYQYFA